MGLGLGLRSIALTRALTRSRAVPNIAIQRLPALYGVCRWLQTEEASGQNILILCNAIGSPVDSKYRPASPLQHPPQNRLALLSAWYSAPVSTVERPPSRRLLGSAFRAVALIVELQDVKLFSLRRRISMEC